MQKEIEPLLKRISIAIIMLVGIVGVYSARGLYADGSFWLFQMLRNNGFFIFDEHRAHVQLLVEAPVALAIWLNISELSTLIRTHSFGVIGIPLLLWLGALAFQWKSKLFWLFLMAFSVTYLRTNFFSAGEFSTTYALTAICAAILLRTKVSWAEGILLVFFAVVLSRSYEATLFLGLFLAVLSGLHLKKGQHEGMGVKLTIFLSLMFFLGAAYIGIRSAFYLRSYDASSTMNFSALLEYHFLYLICVSILLLTLVLERTVTLHKILFVIAVVLELLYFLYVFRWDSQAVSYGYLSYAYRALCAFLLLGILFSALLIFYRPKVALSRVNSAPTSYLIVGTFLFFLTLAAPMIHNTFGYYKWAQKFELIATEISAHTNFDDTTISANKGWTSGYNWMWGNPATSILLRGDAKAIVLNNRAHTGYEPIDQNKIFPEPLQQYKKSALLFP